jgi:hypothetical protein
LTDPRGDLGNDVRGDHDRRQHVAGRDLALGGRACRDVHDVDLAEQLLCVFVQADASATERDRLAGRGFVDDRYSRLGGTRRDREADQQRDRHRIEDQQRHQ